MPTQALDLKEILLVLRRCLQHDCNEQVSENINCAILASIAILCLCKSESHFVFRSFLEGAIIEKHLRKCKSSEMKDSVARAQAGAAHLNANASCWGNCCRSAIVAYPLIKLQGAIVLSAIN